MAAAATASADGLKAAKTAIELIDSLQEKVIPWATYEETKKTFKDSRDKLSRDAAEVSGEVVTLLENAKDEYKGSIDPLVVWCRTTPDLLQTYLDLLDEDADEQKNLVLCVMKQGIDAMNKSKDELRTCSRSFNECAGKLATLEIVLQNDFDESSAFFQDKVDKLRKEAYAGAASGIVGGIVGLAISYSIAAGVVEGSLIPNLKSEMETTQRVIGEIQRSMRKCAQDIEDTKELLDKEIEIISAMHADVAKAEAYVGLPVLLKTKVTQTVGDLIHTCEAYAARHSG